MSSCSSSWSDVQNVQMRPEPPIRKKRIKSLMVKFLFVHIMNLSVLFVQVVLLYTFIYCRGLRHLSVRIINDIVNCYTFSSISFDNMPIFLSIFTFQFLFWWSKIVFFYTDNDLEYSGQFMIKEIPNK